MGADDDTLRPPAGPPGEEPDFPPHEWQDFLEALRQKRNGTLTLSEALYQAGDHAFKVAMYLFAAGDAIRKGRTQ